MRTVKSHPSDHLDSTAKGATRARRKKSSSMLQPTAASKRIKKTTSYPSMPLFESVLKDPPAPPLASAAPAPAQARTPRSGYRPPAEVHETTLGSLLEGVRSVPVNQQRRLGFDGTGSGMKLWYAGDASLLSRPCVAIVGTRKVSRDGAIRARRLARALADAGVVVVSGLAMGVDTEGLRAAIDAGGRTTAVIGTPLTKATPVGNAQLQELIYSEHLLISQFPAGAPVYPANFPARNRVMAAVSDATVIIEASDTSGALHQAAECKRLGRWLFIAKSVAEDRSLKWPTGFLGQYERARILAEPEDVLKAVLV